MLEPGRCRQPPSEFPPRLKKSHAQLNFEERNQIFVEINQAWVANGFYTYLQFDDFDGLFRIPLLYETE